MQSAFFQPRPKAVSSSSSRYDAELQLAIARSLKEQESDGVVVVSASSKRPRLDIVVGARPSKEVEVVDLLSPPEDEDEDQGGGSERDESEATIRRRQDEEPEGSSLCGGGGGGVAVRDEDAEDFDADDIPLVDGEVVDDDVGKEDVEEAEEEEEEEEEEKQPPPAAPAGNPFAAFMFSSGSGACSSSLLPPVPRPSSQPPSSKVSVPKKSKGKKPTCSECEDFSTLSPLTVSLVLSKWHSLASPTAPLPVRRFQLLVAARLHAQTQDPVVRAAMSRLHAHFASLAAAAAVAGAVPSDVHEGGRQSPSEDEDERGGGGSGRRREGGPPSSSSLVPGFDAKTVATCDGLALAAVFPSVHFANSKGTQIVRAAKELCERFGGQVPTEYAELKTLTGVGHKFATLLEFVNSEERHVQYLEELRAKSAASK